MTCALLPSAFVLFVTSLTRRTLPRSAIFGADATNKTLTDVRTSFGAATDPGVDDCCSRCVLTATARCVAGVHAIISSPLILSMDITPAGGQVDLYWPLLSNREAIAGEHRRLPTTLLAELRRS